MSKIQFWYEFASNYSYLSAMRIEAMAAPLGIVVEWKPFLLGPIFAAQGWTTSPFKIYPAKGRHMLRDMERICADRGLPAFRLPDPFPQNSIRAARLALIGAQDGWAPAFTRALYALEFAEGLSLADDGVLARALGAAGQEPAAQLRRAEEQAVKDALRRQTAQAQTLGIFGAPSFVTPAGELFWGDDRMEQALDWCRYGR